jgi:hypothetical protein
LATRYSFSSLARVVLLAAVPCLVISGCKKPDEDLGLDLLPGDPLGLMVDTLELRAYTVVDSAVRTSALSRNLLGSYLDTEFGLVKAGVVAQIRLSANNIGSGQNNSELVPDSLVLSLAFDGVNYVYGNLNPQVFEVYELAEDLSVDSAYKSDRLPQTLTEDLNLRRGGRITPQPLTNPFIGGDSLVPQLRIPLSQELAQRFIDAFGSTNMADNTAFLEFFKGIYVTVNNGTQMPFEAGVLYFNLLSTASKVTLYYRNVVTAPTEQRTLDFLINQNCVRYTTMVHERGSAYSPDLLNALADTSTNASATYVQALGGLRTIIRVPDLMDLAGEGRVLSKAELVVPVKGSYYPAYLPPSQLFIFRKDEDDKDVFLPDQLNGIGAIDGTYRSDERAYRFNITRYVQQVLNGTLPNSRLALVSSSNGVSANRVVLAGPEDGSAPMKLRLTFTTY